MQAPEPSLRRILAGEPQRLFHGVGPQPRGDHMQHPSHVAVRIDIAPGGEVDLAAVQPAELLVGKVRLVKQTDVVLVDSFSSSQSDDQGRLLLGENRRKQRVRVEISAGLLSLCPGHISLRGLDTEAEAEVAVPVRVTAEQATVGRCVVVLDGRTAGPQAAEKTAVGPAVGWRLGQLLPLMGVRLQLSQLSAAAAAG